MSDLRQFFGPNAGYVIELYEQYQADPSSVDEETRAFFARWQPPSMESLKSDKPPETRESTFADASSAMTSDNDVARIVGAARMCRMIREVGHMAAHIDPLGAEPPGDPDLELATHGITASDLMSLPATVVGGPLTLGAANALDAITRLRHCYSGTVGYETDHIQVSTERDWLYEAIESRRFFHRFGAEKMQALLVHLTEIDTLEQYLQKVHGNMKRFSLEGNDMLVPMLNALADAAANAGAKEVVIGMAHRGRLNVLAHVMGKPYEAILAGFKDPTSSDKPTTNGHRVRNGWLGDVKYHLGWERDYETKEGHQTRLTLVPNPSHLEAANPVVEGRVRAAQDARAHAGDAVQNDSAALAILVHGDAAFPGQGVVAETLNLGGLKGYKTGGTIHIIVNNQIGFTANPNEGRSTLYASDLAKGFEIPIVHVNADDPIACLAVTLMAHEYREKFRKDFLIDLVGYRRYGHNEQEEPAYTQPIMYNVIRAHPRLREQWANKLADAKLTPIEASDALVKQVEDRLKTARNAPPQPTGDAGLQAPRLVGENQIETGVPKETLVALNEALLALPEGFTPNSKLERNFLKNRRARITVSKGIDWGHAEALAFASILAEGTPIRLTGQDSERGTFNHRNAVLHDALTGEKFIALQSLAQSRASFALHNSPLSENAVVGFEYGYSMHAPGVLVLWEAQFGDFSNGAQIVIDQFLVSGNAKWRQTPSLVLLLPHGYEGMGPEHSSARLERFLQLAATDNIRVANCTNSAQFFHLLRLQAARMETAPRPLIVMTPKSLLREPMASSSLEDLTHGSFQTILDDPVAQRNPEAVTRLVLCSGKVYMDLCRFEPFQEAQISGRVACARMEQLYPFPGRELREIFARYKNLQDVVWLQEEPRNMGAWLFVSRRISDPELGGWQGPILYAGRPNAASPAEGSKYHHDEAQRLILQEALTSTPATPQKVPVASQSR